MRLATLSRLRLAALCFGASLAIGVTAFTATANAVGCSQDWVCFYVNSNYGGSSYAHYKPSLAVPCYGIPLAYNDTFSSVMNVTSMRLLMYRDAGCLGIAYQVPAMHGQPSFHWTWNDTVSSYKVVYP